MAVKIIEVTKELPQYMRETNEILPFVSKWLEGKEDRFKRKVLKIFENAAVGKRYGIMSIEEVFTASSFEAKNNVYAREVKKLGTAVLKKALTNASWTPDSLDFIITVSCTGIMIPSLDAYIINEVKLKQDIVRLPVTEMGCAAGVSGIIYARNFLKANPGKRAAVIAVESPTATLQLEDFSMVNMVSAAIFGDGAACTLLSSESDAKGPKILADEMYHFYDATTMMGFNLTNSGLQMVLDQKVPEKIATHFSDIIHPFLAKQGKTIEDVKHLIFHPGGKKIIQTVEELFGGLGKNIEETKTVLKNYGNMSSATVLYVLEEVMKKKPEKGDLGLMLSFGPGFSAQRILIQW